MLPSYHFNIKTTKIIKFLTDEVGTLYISKLVKKTHIKCLCFTLSITKLSWNSKIE